MAGNRFNESLKYPRAWMAALFILIVALAAGYYFDVGDVIWVVAVGAAVTVYILLARRHKENGPNHYGQYER